MPTTQEIDYSKEYTSILQKAFLSNAYPTVAEKRLIAKQAGIEYKQVHVWVCLFPQVPFVLSFLTDSKFQNKRNRCKREGRKVQKLAFVTSVENITQASRDRDASRRMPPSPSVSRQYLACNLRHESLCSHLIGCLKPTAKIEPSASTISCPFDIDRPPYAFPTVFSPLSDYAPFPVLGGKQTFETPWPHYTTVEQHKSKTDGTIMDIDQLCAPLSMLNLADRRSLLQASPQKVVGRLRGSCSHAAACFPTLIYPPMAPLPALVSATVTVHPRRGSPVPSLSKHVVHVPTPPTESGRIFSPRKSVSTSAQRVPPFLSKAARNLSRPYQPQKPPGYKPQQARYSRLSSTSLLSSLASEGSCSSRASSVSLESPPPLTPPQLPVALPQFIKISVPDVIFSPSRDIDSLFGNTDPSKHAHLAHLQAQVVQ